MLDWELVPLVGKPKVGERDFLTGAWLRGIWAALLDEDPQRLVSFRCENFRHPQLGALRVLLLRFC